MKHLVYALSFILLSQTAAFATWSVIALDRATGQVSIASATCVAQGRFAGFPADGLMDIQAVVVPGIGVAACFVLLFSNTHPFAIIGRGP